MRLLRGGDADALQGLCGQARAAVEEFSVAVPRLIALSGQVQGAATALEGYDVTRRFFVPSDADASGAAVLGLAR